MTTKGHSETTGAIRATAIRNKVRKEAMDKDTVTPLSASRPVGAALSSRIRQKLKRIYLDCTAPRYDREFRRIAALAAGVEGWLDPGEQRFLFDFAYKLPRDANILEVGSFKGRSTCFLAAACRGTKRRVFAVDTFNGSDGDYFGHRNFFCDFESNLSHCGVAKYVKPVVGKSCEIAKTWNLPISLLFIDGSHEYGDVLADFRGFFPHVVSGGIVAFHDVTNPQTPGVGNAWAELNEQLADIGYCESIAFGRKRKPVREEFS